MQFGKSYLKGDSNMMKVNPLKTGAILSYISMIIGFVIPIIYTPIMLGILGQNEYGIYSLANSVISYLTILNLGMGQAIIRYISYYRAKDDYENINRILSLFLIIFMILALVVLLGGLILFIGTPFWFNKGLTISEISTLRILILIMTLSTSITFISSVFSAACTSFEKYIFRRILEIIGTLLAPILNLVVLFLGYKSIGMALVGLMYNIFLMFIYIYYSYKKLKIRILHKNLPLDRLKEIFSFSIYVFISSLVDMLYWSTDKVLIGSMIGSVAVAVYNVGGTFSTMFQNLSNSIGNVFGPRVNRLVAIESSKDVYNELLIRIGRIQFFIIALAFTGYVVFGRVFIHFWAGDTYQEAYVIALLTMGPLIIPLIQNIALTTAVAKNKHRFRAIIYFIIAIANIVGTYLTIPTYGIIGAATCTCIAFIIGHGFVMNIYYYKVLQFDIISFWKNIIRISFIPILMMIIGLIIFRYYIIQTFWEFGLCVIGYTLLYIILNYFINFNGYEKNLIKEPIQKILRWCKYGR